MIGVALKHEILLGNGSHKRLLLALLLQWIYWYVTSIQWSVNGLSFSYTCEATCCFNDRIKQTLETLIY